MMYACALSRSGGNMTPPPGFTDTPTQHNPNPQREHNKTGPALV